MENRLSLVRPDLAAEWSEKNLPLTPEDMTYGSQKIVWWKCSKGHEWQASIHSRAGSNSSGCPYCSHSKVMPGFNDLASQFPKVAAEWSDRNLPLLPTQVTAFCNRKVWWKCSKGHEYLALVSSRSSGHGCPYCAGEKVLPGLNDFASKHPDLAAEWSDKNRLKPNQIAEKKAGLFWWKCKVCGGEYQAWITSRLKGSRCPYCSGKKLLVGVNDLATIDPEIAKEWNNHRNLGITPQQVMGNSRKVYWWKCSKGHEWKASVFARCESGKECPICESEFLTDLPRMLIAYYAHSKGLEVRMDDEKVTGLPVDAYLPEIGLIMDLSEGSKAETRSQQIKRHICSARGIQYVLINSAGDAEQIAERIREAFQTRHIYFDSQVVEDVLIARNTEIW